MIRGLWGLSDAVRAVPMDGAPAGVSPGLLAACKGLTHEDLLELMSRMEAKQTANSKSQADSGEAQPVGIVSVPGETAQRGGLSVAAAAARRKAELRKALEKQDLSEEELFKIRQKELVSGLKKRPTADNGARAKETPEERAARLAMEEVERKREEVSLECTGALSGAARWQLTRHRRQCESGRRWGKQVGTRESRSSSLGKRRLEFDK